MTVIPVTKFIGLSGRANRNDLTDVCIYSISHRNHVEPMYWLYLNRYTLLLVQNGACKSDWTAGHLLDPLLCCVCSFHNSLHGNRIVKLNELPVNCRSNGYQECGCPSND